MNAAELVAKLRSLRRESPDYAIEFVDTVLAAAGANRVSDVHMQPTPRGLRLDWRLDGVLQSLGEFPPGKSTDVVTRLKVLAGLLTYRCELPQEGRLAAPAGGLETRVSTFPTLHGERAAIRFFVVDRRLERLADLGWSSAMLESLTQLTRRTSGAILVCGPAGSGKTTTAYAMLRDIVAESSGGRSVFSLEDPIEVPVDGVVQAQANPAVGFNLSTALRSLLRQDPEVILVGEIRDRETAEVFLQASLTGHLVIATFHAGSSTEALTRLLDMDLEPYQLASGLLGIVTQRLVRTLCSCRVCLTGEHACLGAMLERVYGPGGCSVCQQTGYCGRQMVAELLMAESSAVRQGLLQRIDNREMARLATLAGMVPLRERVLELVASGVTSPAEAMRVLGPLAETN